MPTQDLDPLLEDHEALVARIAELLADALTGGEMTRDEIVHNLAILAALFEDDAGLGKLTFARMLVSATTDGRDRRPHFAAQALVARFESECDLR